MDLVVEFEIGARAAMFVMRTVADGGGLLLVVESGRSLARWAIQGFGLDVCGSVVDEASVAGLEVQEVFHFDIPLKAPPIGVVSFCTLVQDVVLVAARLHAVREVREDHHCQHSAKTQAHRNHYAASVAAGAASRLHSPASAKHPH